MRNNSGNIINRFHPENGITPVDPTTGSRIVGEINFYLIENPFESEVPPEDKPISLNGLSGKFIGTDNTFVNNPQL